jgi:lysozyme
MKISQDGVDLIKECEGVARRPYLCPANYWTVGVGSMLYPEQIALRDSRQLFQLKVEDDRPWADDEIDQLFRHDLRRFERGVTRLIDYPLSQNQFDALVSFAFNLGNGSLQASTLRRKLNRGDVEGASNEFKRWVRAGGRVLRGLVRRRQMEADLFLGRSHAN